MFSLNAIAAALVTLLSTFAGGACAFRFRDRLHLVLSFTAGVLLGVVAFNILPEIFARAHQHGSDGLDAMVGLVVGFLLFHSIEKFVLVHHVHEDDYAEHHHPQVGMLSALALIGHSFMDGVGIGLAFQISEAVGIAVAMAVIMHDFCDGLNTVSLMLVHRNSNAHSLAMLILDAMAPVAGVLSTVALRAALPMLNLYLGFFAGFLLYIAVADVLPEAHSRARSVTAVSLIGLTALGSGLMYLVMRLMG
ncbi:ZIP family metal transporter [Cupriavidus sp. CuC1]|uniref:ZIP family metal transporter n=1 Tax=Cupriavidus sp. CuC1 TaxID=3373131 RepID=UPI0037CD2966